MYRMVLQLVLFLLFCNSNWASQSTQMVVMTDGTKLATDIYIPEGTGPFPAVLVRTVYNKDNASNLQYYNDYGIAVVIQDCRGRFASEGEDCIFQCDQSDAHDTLKWINNQDWSDGNVVSEGGSALGIVQYMAAPNAPQNLQAMFAVVATPNVCEHIMFWNGVFRESLAARWLEGQGSGWFLDILAQHTDCDDPFWASSTTKNRYDQVTVPTVHLNGWFDIFSQGTLDAFMGYQSQSQAPNDQYLIMGPWTHGFGSDFPLDGTADMFSFPNTEPPHWIDGALWTAHYLGVMDMSEMLQEVPPVQYYVMGDVFDEQAPGNTWREAEQWPPESSLRRWYLQPVSGLSNLAPSIDTSTTQYVYDPQDPCPTLGGNNLTLPAGPRDQRPIESRADVLVFQTPVLSQPLEVTGRIHARIYVSTDVPDTDIIIRLTDVYPDGKSMLILDAPAPLSQQGAYIPGTVVRVDVDLWSTSIIFNQGHRMRISITSSNAPRFRVNPNDGSVFGANNQTQIANVSIHHDSQHASFIETPDPSNAVDETQIQRWLPHITSTSGGFRTRLLVSNTQNQDETFQIIGMDASGNTIASKTLAIESQKLQVFEMENLFDQRPSHVGFSGNVGFTAIYENENNQTSPAHMLEISQKSKRWRVHPGNWSLVFDGIAIINRGETNTQISVLHKNYQGNVLESIELPEMIAPLGKKLYVLGSPAGSEFSEFNNTYFEIESDQEISLIALRGTPPGNTPAYLWVNPSVPLTMDKAQ